MAFEAAASSFEFIAFGGDGGDAVEGGGGVEEVEGGDGVLDAGEEMEAVVGVCQAERCGDGFGEVVDQFIGG